MNNRTSSVTRATDLHVILLIALHLSAVLAGVLSFDTTQITEFTNQFGDTVQLYGAGIYARDSFFKAIIAIGSDAATLIIAIPVYILAYLRFRRTPTLKPTLWLLSLTVLNLYYAISLAASFHFNALYLVYLADTALCWTLAVQLLRRLYALPEFRFPAQTPLTRGLAVFLGLSAAALTLAWLPDILEAFAAGRSLTLIQNYSTEITYLLDMAFIGPALLLTLHLLRQRSRAALPLLSALLTACSFIAFILIGQTIVQILAGIIVPPVQLLTKVASFLLLSFFALYFLRRLYRAL